MGSYGACCRGRPDTASLTPVAAGDTNGAIWSLWPWVGVLSGREAVCRE